MERLSLFTAADGGTDIVLRLASNRLGVKASRLYGWFKDKARQFRSLQGNEELTRALFAAENSPVEGARHRVGERLNVYGPDGELRRFKICGIQSGGFSNVYVVIDLDEMRPYCLKENRALPGNEQRKNGKLAVEAEISLRLGLHPNLVRTYAAFFIRGRLFILTEYIPSASLDHRLNDGPIPLETALDYSIHLCRALNYAQETLPGFVHGDIKPGNCFITAEGSLKLGDFGLASAAGLGKHSPNGLNTDGRRSRELTTSPNWGGTIGYMSPEMFDKISPDRKAADIYAFGITLFEMLSGIRPFISDSKNEIVEMQRHMEPPLEKLTERAVPSPIVELVRQCLEKLPEDRPVSFESIEYLLCQTIRHPISQFIPPALAKDETESEIASRTLSLAILGNYEQSAALIDSAISGLGISAELLACKAVALSLTGYINAAYDASTASLRLGSDRFVVLLAHARVLICKGNLSAAENYLLRALRLQPDNCVVLNLMGSLLTRLEQYDEARIFLDKSRTVDNEQAEAWEGLANINLLEGHMDRAISLAEKALSIDPYRAVSHRILGDAYVEKQQPVEAIKSFKSALRFESVSKQTVRRFVRTCRGFYEVSGRGMDFQKLRILMTGATLLQNEGERRIPAGSFASNFIRTFRDNDLDPLLLFFLDATLGKIAADLDKKNADELCDGLRIVWHRAANKKLASHLLYSLGRIFYHFGDFENCRNVFTQMLDQIGPNENSFYYLAACSEIGGDFQSSLKFYKKALRIADWEDSRTGIQRVSAKIRQSVQGAGSR